jgi:ring-1,2-phenylacetyl-CoA epoxidase subunit PaaE
MDNNPAYQKVTVKSIREEVAGVKTFVLEPEQEIKYKAGQFLTFTFEHVNGEERRSYSLSSSPAMGEPLTITVKRVENGKYSRPLIDVVRAGDTITTTGAAGQFILPPDITKYRQVIFFAAGIGITPIYSIIKTLLAEQPEVEVILIYSNSSVTNTVFYDELIELHRRFPNQLRLEFLISSSRNLSRARLSKWLMPQLLHQYTKALRDEQLFYTCGPFAYMRMVIIALEELGYSSEQVKKENFDTSRPVMKKEPPDKAEYEVRLRLPGGTESFKTRYPTTILQAAKKDNIVLPYSCETGKCGSCVMTCTSGTVWMSYNEVLTDKEVQEGKVLTCVGYPIGGDVELE